MPSEKSNSGKRKRIFINIFIRNGVVVRTGAATAISAFGRSPDNGCCKLHPTCS